MEKDAKTETDNRLTKLIIRLELYRYKLRLIEEYNAIPLSEDDAKWLEKTKKQIIKWETQLLNTKIK